MNKARDETNGKQITRHLRVGRLSPDFSVLYVRLCAGLKTGSRLAEHISLTHICWSQPIGPNLFQTNL